MSLLFYSIRKYFGKQNFQTNKNTKKRKKRIIDNKVS